MRRRELLGGGLSLAAASTARAQSGGKQRRLAIFSPSESTGLMREDGPNAYYRVLFEELRRLGFVEGQNLTVERYGKEQTAAGLEAMAAEIVRSAPDVIYAIGALTYFRGLTTIPVVAISSDPVALGVAQSLARPGGNFTGVSVDTGPSIYGKRIELLREVVPKLSKLAYLGMRIAWQMVQGAGVQAAARTAEIALTPVLLEQPTTEGAYRAAIAGAARDGAQAMMVGDSADTMANETTILSALAALRLPAMHTFPEAVQAGGLMAYSFDLAELNRQAAADIAAILRGAKPGEIPFYQATTFLLSVNLKTAKRLGLTFPPSILGRADRIVE
ncbi:putative ABC transport system substrate-binding protein [Enhydrobacter aerosaccus]|uniref:Putative ABC transport system substrate-binding protein n=1 Tax=Enhydrobacter aerosaccus TaxID=225324 RepID=A0A1T4T311_9HYPH|nr:ABC transporter substrate-binding protein [Enhydrobacter aerosaccus]SKA34875.1 putative ABC transport system substrate-binding protein [Enhydrobacter aerosaccus]